VTAPAAATPRRWAHRRGGPERTSSFRLLVGLRPRLVIAFVVVALVSGAAVAAASYRQARNELLQNTQNSFAGNFRENLEQLAPSIRYPPGQQELDRISDAINGVVIFGKARSGTLAGGIPDVPASLRTAVEQKDRLVAQRVTSGGAAYVVAGTRLGTNANQASGIEVYAARSLTAEQSGVDRLARSAAAIMGLAVLLAVLLALGAAAGVLRPVRELRGGARDLANGRLDTRLRPRGADELAELVRTFNTMAATMEHNVGELRRMEANGRRFVADVSHELRTPLTAMTAVTEALDEEAVSLDGDAAVAARIVSTETKKLRQLVDNLIEISRFDARGATLRVEEVNVAMAVAATLAARGWTDEVKADLPTDIMIEVDRRRLDVIVANLVGNALKHGATPVTVDVWTDAGWLVLTVTDSGSGLAPEILPYVFERFYKADSARARSEGSGLGLAIAWENAQLHGGSIEAGNAPGAGARFTLRIPVATPRRPA
jgi:two-component system sensor histidine kinase MtrB